jgi:CheY-like chemotaxis protein
VPDAFVQAPDDRSLPRTVVPYKGVVNMNEKKILVVEDQEQIRKTYKRILERAGYLVIAAKSAEEALEILPKHPCNVLFLDIDLPGMDGIELCKIIRRQWPMAITHAVTAYASLYQLSECRDAGFEDYYIKPLKAADMRRAAELAFEKLERWKKG